VVPGHFEIHVGRRERTCRGGCERHDRLCGDDRLGGHHRLAGHHRLRRHEGLAQLGNVAVVALVWRDAVVLGCGHRLAASEIAHRPGVGPDHLTHLLVRRGLDPHLDRGRIRERRAARAEPCCFVPALGAGVLPAFEAEPEDREERVERRRGAWACAAAFPKPSVSSTASRRERSMTGTSNAYLVPQRSQNDSVTV